MGITLASTRGISREQWLELRQCGIGGSDAPVVCGVSPYRTPLELWMEKTGEAVTITGDDTSPAMYWGTMLEDVVAREFGMRHPELMIRRRNAILQHPDHPWMLANIDRGIIDTVNGNGVLEVKTGSAYRAGEWDGDQVPDHYMLQVMHYLAVTGLQYAYLAVLLGGQNYLERRVDRDDALIADLIAIEQDFWRLVETRTPPPLDGTPASSAFLKRKYPEGNGESIDLPDEADTLVEQYQQAAYEVKASTQRRDEAQNRLCELLGENEVGTTKAHVVRWTTCKRDGYTVQPSAYRKFSVK